MPTERLLPKTMEDSSNSTTNKNRERRNKRRTEIPSNQPTKHRGQGAREAPNRQNQPLPFFQQPNKQQSVRLSPSQKYYRRRAGSKIFALHHIKQREYVVMISLDVLGAFDAAWRPGILNNLRNLRCPRNLYNLTRSYFSDRLAIWQTNTHRIERKASRGCPQRSCSGPSFWNVLYDSLLNLE